MVEIMNELPDLSMAWVIILVLALIVALYGKAWWRK
jgi:hypothetical protein